MQALRDAIARLPMPTLWRRLGLPGTIRGNCQVRSPLRDDDRSPSFSVYAGGTRWRDHGLNLGGDSFDFFCAITRLDKRTALPRFLDLAGVATDRRRRRRI